MARRVSYHLTSVTLRAIDQQADAAVYRGAQRIRGRAISNIRRLGRVNTGKMIQGLQVRALRPVAGGRVAYQVASTAPYTVFQELGTRAHGPRAAKAMRFTPKGGGAVVFAKWVRGVTPGHFMRNAMNASTAADFAE